MRKEEGGRRKGEEGRMRKEGGGRRKEEEEGGKRMKEKLQENLKFSDRFLHAIWGTFAGVLPSYRLSDFPTFLGPSCAGLPRAEAP